LLALLACRSFGFVMVFDLHANLGAKQKHTPNPCVYVAIYRHDMAFLASTAAGARSRLRSALSSTQNLMLHKASLRRL